MRANRAVTVIMPVYNPGEFLAPAIESLLRQTFGDFELIIVDDGSQDDSAAVMKEFARRDRRIRNFFQPKNSGIAATRNFALKHARGRWIGFLNHDDVALPERLERQLAFLQENDDVALLGTSIENIDATGASLNLSPMPETDLEIHWFGLLDCPIRQSSLIMKREVFAEHGIYYDPAVVSYSDYDFVARAIRVLHGANLPAPLTQYRKHPGNTSRQRWQMFVESGARIALDAIRAELPEFEIDLAGVAAMRSVLFSYKPLAERNSLLKINRAVARYLDLFEAFTAKHAAHPLLADLRKPDGAELLARKRGEGEESAP